MNRYVIYSFLFTIVTLFLSCNHMNHKVSKSEHKYTNKLIDESSPYLLQHAHNPVDWYPWGDEAFEKAKAENKLLIISIGYAACHWCHVMEHESFEDSIVASIMNDNFISIKVDREERPDVDDIYMTAAQLLTGSGGWPLNAIALPDGRPIFAGTYYPKENWKNILNQISSLQINNPKRLEDSADKITKGIRSMDEIIVNEEDLTFTSEELSDFNEKVTAHIDYRDGGRKGAPKFPMPNTYEYLLKYYWLTADQRSKKAIDITLEKMALGGIYDQLGGGFARYSVDEFWLVPHFEKMLYDNGQLISLYAKAYQMDSKDLYKRTIESSIEYIEREMTSKENGFYSSLDADSEGEEGKFYVWEKEEIDSIIKDEEKAKIFNAFFGVKKNGNWEHNNILNIEKDYNIFADERDIDEYQLKKIIEECSLLLMNHRSKRIRPGLDDKILTSWNALMINGYIDAYKALGNNLYLDKALANAHFLIDKQMSEDGRLDRNYKNGKSSINAFLDDYALLIHAFINLYQVTFNEKWLDLSTDLLEYTKQHFFNDETKMFNYTSDLDPPLIARKAEYSDNVIPGSNSMMARNLFTLGTLKYNPEHQTMATQMLKNMHSQFKEAQMLSFFSNWMQLYFDKVKAPYEIAIVGPDAETLRKELSSHYLANAIILGGTNEGTLELLKDKLQEGETYIYVCQNKVCKFPVKTVNEALELIDNGL